MVVSTRRLVQGAGYLIFALICGVGLYSNHEGLDGTAALPDAVHTRLIQYGEGGPHWVTPDQYLRWQLSWVVLAVLGVAFVGLVFANFRLSGRWQRLPSPWSGRTVSANAGGSGGCLGRFSVRSPIKLAAIIGIADGAMVATTIMFAYPPNPWQAVLRDALLFGLAAMAIHGIALAAFFRSWNRVTGRVSTGIDLFSIPVLAMACFLAFYALLMLAITIWAVGYGLMNGLPFR